MKKMMTFVALLLMTMVTQAQELKSVAYRDDEQQLNGLITSNAGNNLPAVLILPAWKGIDNEARQAAIDLEKAGYVAFIADIYGEGNIPTDNMEASKLSAYYKHNYKAYQHRIELALVTLKMQNAGNDKIAVIGYCFGGTGALEAARGDLPVAGVVSIHGGLGKASSRANTVFNTKVLIEHPSEDNSVSRADYDGIVAELNQGNADWQIITYAHCGHTFTNPESPEYNKAMAERAWQHCLLFLKEVLK